MFSSLKLRKSAGVPVTAEVHRLLADGNAARDGRAWATAAAAYRSALDRDPDLFHIWIQYGHALKEAGNRAEARAAYEEAAKKRPQSAEPLLHLGHIHKQQGDRPAALHSYIAAAKRDPRHPDVLSELYRLASVTSGNVDLQDILSALQDIVGPEGETPPSLVRTPDEAQTALHHSAGGRTSESVFVFDVSDLISYFRNARLPTGIQRVQIEAITGMLASRGADAIRICAFVERRDEWVEVPAASFVSLAHLSLVDGDRTAPDWQAAMTRLHVSMNMRAALTFPDGAFLINLGTSWWLQNYFLFVRHAKRQHRVRYVPFVHDLIPAIASEHCTQELTRDFISWIMGVFEHADFFLVNSEATKKDLIAVAAQLGHSVAADRICVVRLNADFRKPEMAHIGTAALAKWGLKRTPFVLFVSTIESRKNHVGAFDAWIELIRRHGLRRMPKLVCVGNRGWLNDAVYAKLGSHKGLRDRVLMLSGLSDAELALLYRSCLFTLYPSWYEGWGLPVTESLCYGKPVLLSDTSSLPEAGGEFATYFESGSTERMVEALERLIYDHSYRRGLEYKIAEEFRPRPWRDVGEEMVGAVTDWARSADEPDVPGPEVPTAADGAYYPIVRNHETRIRRGLKSAEVFRTDVGWWHPDDWGCWTKAQGAALEIGMENPSRRRLYLRLHGLPRKSCRYEVQVCGSAPAQEGSLAPGAFRWLTFDVEPEVGRKAIRILIQGSETEDLATVTDGRDTRIVSVGVCGFLLCLADDLAGRFRFLEAMALGNIEDLVFNRKPASSLSKPGGPDDDNRKAGA